MAVGYGRGISIKTVMENADIKAKCAKPTGLPTNFRLGQAYHVTEKFTTPAKTKRALIPRIYNP